MTVACPTTVRDLENFIGGQWRPASSEGRLAWFPFAGWKDSIDGDLHANGTDAVEFRKTVVTSRWARGADA